MSNMRDHIAVAAFFVCVQSRHGSWYRLHIPSCILVRSVKISSIRSTVEFSVCFWTFPRIRSWTSLTVSQVAMEYMVFMLEFIFFGWVSGCVGLDRCFGGWICWCLR